MNRRIRFPRLHIATSVVNRIMNTADELERSTMAPAPPPAPLEPPAVPDSELEGLKLDERLDAPPPQDVPALETPEPADDELAAAIARGDDLISAGA